jgi:hypothetical protein
MSLFQGQVLENHPDVFACPPPDERDSSAAPFRALS